MNELKLIIDKSEQKIKISGVMKKVLNKKILNDLEYRKNIVY